jgi:hypothetical protein
MSCRKGKTAPHIFCITLMPTNFSCVGVGFSISMALEDTSDDTTFIFRLLFALFVWAHCLDSSIMAINIGRFKGITFFYFACMCVYVCGWTVVVH